MNKRQTATGSASHALSIGDIPRVIGTLSRVPGKLPATASEIPSDIVECRMDLLPADADWLNCCQKIESLGVPVIQTIRHQGEGGRWTGAEVHRLQLYERALEHVSLVDVELNSEIAVHISEAATRAGKACIISFHDFEKTPSLDELRVIAIRARKFASIVKISTMAKTERDIETLGTLLLENSGEPLCVIAMGPLGTQTRVSFPTLGSCLTYGYLDEPAAPGQLSAVELVRQLRRALPKYDEDYVLRKGINERAATPAQL